MPAVEEPKNVVKKIEIEVVVDGHIHEGKVCKKGAKIMVSEDVAGMLKKAWMVNNAAS